MSEVKTQNEENGEEEFDDKPNDSIDGEPEAETLEPLLDNDQIPNTASSSNSNGNYERVVLSFTNVINHLSLAFRSAREESYSPSETY